MKISSLLFVVLAAAVLIGPACNSKDSEKGWFKEKVSDSGNLTARLLCAEAPNFGGFQNCRLFLTATDEAITAARISIDGGMVSHGHGLPTAPKVVEEKEAGYYRIEGLKFSMPGAWVLGFRVSTKDQTDKIIFNLTL